jgi:non-heme chloroperoxidase
MDSLIGDTTMPFIDVRDGTSIYYFVGGTGSPVVFVSSAWLSSRMWELQFPRLVDQGLRCVAYDRRGHGRSDWPWDGYDYDTLADDLATVLEHLDVRDATLVGHSAGCGEIVRYLTRHGADRVARVALVSGTTPFPMQTDENPDGVDRAFMQADLDRRTADRPKWFADNADGFFGIDLPGVSVSPERVQFMIQQCLDCSARATSAFFLTGFTTDLRPELQTLTVPTLIIHGDRDRQAPIDVCGRKTAQLVPNNRFIEYENAAHGLFITHAERLTADLLAFALSERHIVPENAEAVGHPASSGNGVS